MVLLFETCPQTSKEGLEKRYTDVTDALGTVATSGRTSCQEPAGGWQEVVHVSPPAGAHTGFSNGGGGGGTIFRVASDADGPPAEKCVTDDEGDFC